MDSVQPPSVKESAGPEEKVDASSVPKGSNDTKVNKPQQSASTQNDSSDEIIILESELPQNNSISVSSSDDEVKIVESVSAQNNSTDVLHNGSDAKILGSVSAQKDSIDVSNDSDEVKKLKSESVQNNSDNEIKILESESAQNNSINVSSSGDAVKTLIFVSAQSGTINEFKIEASKSVQNDNIDTSNSVNRPTNKIKVESLDDYVVLDQVGDPGSESDNHSESASNPKGLPNKAVKPKKIRYSKAARRRYQILVGKGYSVEKAREMAESVPLETSTQKPTNAVGKMTSAMWNQKVKQEGPVHQVISKEVVECVTMCVFHKDYPTVGLSEEQLKMVQASILEKIVSQAASEVKPKFLNTIFKPGLLVLTCADEPTAEWLKRTTAELKPWEGACLIAAKQSEVPKGKLMLGLFPNSANDTDEKILGFVTAQNYEIDISSWSVVNRCVKDDSVELTLMVSEESFWALKKIKFNLNYKFGQVVLHNPKKKGLLGAKALEMPSTSGKAIPTMQGQKRKHSPSWKQLSQAKKKIELGQRNQVFLPPASKKPWPQPNQKPWSQPKPKFQPQPKQKFQSQPKPVFQALPKQKFQSQPKQVFQSQPKQKFQPQLSQQFRSQPKEKFQLQPHQKHQLQPHQKHPLQPQQKHQLQPQQKFRTQPKQKFRSPPDQKSWSQPNQKTWSLSNQRAWSPPADRSWSPPRLKSWSRSSDHQLQHAMGSQRFPQANETWLQPRNRSKWAEHDSDEYEECDFYI